MDELDLFLLGKMMPSVAIWQATSSFAYAVFLFEIRIFVRMLGGRLAPVIFVLYLFFSFSTLFFIMILFNPTSSYLWLNKGLK